MILKCQSGIYYILRGEKVKNKERTDGLIGVFIEIPKDYGQIKEDLGMTWAGIIKLGIESIEKNKQHSRMVDLIANQAKEIEILKRTIRTGQAIDGRDLNV